MGFSQIGISQLATEYYKVPVAATLAGASVNPTSLTVQFAFMPQATQVPQTSDWVGGSWETVAGSILFPYSARCLVGSGGAITLATGVYVAYIKILSSPETVVDIVGYLEIS